MKNKNIKDWSWEEPSDEEFDRRRMSETFFRIFYVGKGKKEISVYKFWASGDKEAKKVLDAYKADHDDGKEYSFDTSGYYMGSDRKRYDSMSEMLDDHRKRKKGKKTPKKPKKVSPKPEAVSKKDLAYYARHRHSPNEWWDIEWHILDDLKFNVPILIEKCHGCPNEFWFRARVEKHPDEKTRPTDLNPTNEEVDRGMELWKEELERLLENIRLYQFYEGYGYFDKKDKLMSKIAEKYGDTIPYVPGTNRRIDYLKLDKLQEKAWNSIWDWLKEYGQALWD